MRTRLVSCYFFCPAWGGAAVLTDTHVTLEREFSAVKTAGEEQPCQ